jgi:hypothetical protein
MEAILQGYRVERSICLRALMQGSPLQGHASRKHCLQDCSNEETPRAIGSRTVLEHKRVKGGIVPGCKH